jgi:HAD superfamily hydrolase (TIGR01509 family)
LETRINQQIKAYIFDLDGTLLDSMWMWGELAERYLISQGATPRPGLCDDLRSLSTIEEAQYYIDEYNVDLPLEEVIEGRDSMILEFFSCDVELKKGVLPILDALRRREVKMCITTATRRNLVEPALKLHGISGYFERIYTCDEEESNKKSPDIYIRAAEYLGTCIKETLVVEDALYAIETAKKAGFIVAGVYDKTADDHQSEIKDLCDYYFKDLGEMLAYL